MICTYFGNFLPFTDQGFVLLPQALLDGYNLPQLLIKTLTTICCALINLLDVFLKDFFYLFGVLRRFQHCTGHITTGSWKGRGNQYIQFARVVYCKLPTNGKQLPAFPLKPVTGTNPGLRGGRRECYHFATVAPF